MKKTLTGIKKFLAVISLILAGNATNAVAGPISNLNLSLGPASGYSGFFFGNVNAAADVEGRLAVGGNMTQGFDVGYRNPYGSTAPSLVVAGSLTMKMREVMLPVRFITVLKIQRSIQMLR